VSAGSPRNDAGGPEPVEPPARLWAALYALVIAALAVEILALAWLTGRFG